MTIRSDTAYNDGAWHHAAASLGANGMKLYVDGELIKSSANTSAQNFTGYWLFGSGDLSGGWPDRPASDFLIGSLDEVAIYNTQLTDQQILWHYYANH